jgi:anti-anti-sigma factor
MEIQVLKETALNLELAFKGKLDTNGADAILPRFYGLLENLKKNVLIDFSEVSFLSSSGIRLLLSGLKLTAKEGYKLYITDPVPEITAVLTMTGLERLVL